jgi:hypothetical protein
MRRESGKFDHHFQTSSKVPSLHARICYYSDVVRKLRPLQNQYSLYRLYEIVVIKS